MPLIPILKRTATLVFALFLTFPAVTQRVVVNSQGDRVIVYPNGSARMADQRDSALVRQYLQQGMPDQNPHDKHTNGQQKNMAEEQEFLLKQWNDLYASIVAEEKVILQQFRDATNAQFKASELLENAEANKQLMEPDLYARLHEEYETSVTVLRSAKRCNDEMQKILKKANKINASLSKLTSDKVEKTRNSFNLFRGKCNPGGHVTVLNNSASTPPPPVVIPASTPVDETTHEAIMVDTILITPVVISAAAIYDPTMVTALPAQYDKRTYTSAPFECKVKTDTVDQSTGTRRIELSPSQVFTHTDPDLRPYFKDKELITAYCRLSKIGPYIYLSIDFHIGSSHAQNNFGSLQNGSLLRLKLFNGEFISLYDLKTDNGRIDPYSGHTIFTGQYALGKKEIKKIKHSSLDKIRVLWATGYEDYDVYHLDILIDQLNCLFSIK